jgi:hypothetical protein
MTTSRSLERRRAFTLACMAVLIVVAEPTRVAAMAAFAKRWRREQ